jgi:endogenous inhibitor of DNA gyrase (YacG/DUF329 family)
MAKKRISSLRCPTCRALVLASDAEFPFCSERCRTIDLGKWASGGYVISTPLNRGDESGEADYASNQRVERVRSDSHRERPGNGRDQGNRDDDQDRR